MDIFLSSYVSRGFFFASLGFPYDFSVADTSLVYILCRRYSVNNKNDYCGFCGIKETEVECSLRCKYNFIFAK